MAKNIGKNKLRNKDIVYVPAVKTPGISGLFFGLIVTFYLPFIIYKNKIDVIILNGLSVWSPFAISLKLLRVPLILDIRTLPIDRQRSILFDISLYLSKYIIDGLTTITPELREILIKKYKLVDTKIGIWSSGVSNKKFIETDINRYTNVKKKNRNIFVLLHHGAYSPTRGIENLIVSISELDNSLKNKVKLLLIGIPKTKIVYLSNLCEELNVQDQIEIIPPVDYKEIPSYILLSDVGVIPLPPENKWWQVSSPLKTLEYLAMGKPIIATNIPFHRRIFDKGECGVLLETGNPKALANAITCLYKNREKLETMGKIGRKIVKDNYTWDNKAYDIEKFLETVIRRSLK